MYNQKGVYILYSILVLYLIERFELKSIIIFILGSRGNYRIVYVHMSLSFQNGTLGNIFNGGEPLALYHN